MINNLVEYQISTDCTPLAGQPDLCRTTRGVVAASRPSGDACERADPEAILPPLLDLDNTVKIGAWQLYIQGQSYPLAAVSLASAGGLVSFSGSAPPDVVQLPSAAACEVCDFSGGTSLHNFSSSAAFDLQLQTAGTYYFACSRDCGGGLKVAVTVGSVITPAPPLSVPSAPYERAPTCEQLGFENK